MKQNILKQEGSTTPWNETRGNEERMQYKEGRTHGKSEI